MKKQLLILLAFCCAVVLPAAENITLGKADFALVINGENGAWRSLRVNGKTVAEADRTRPPFDLELGGNKRLSQVARFKFDAVKQLSADIFEVTVLAGDITGKVRYQLEPAKKRVRQSFTFINNTAKPISIYKFHSVLPSITFGAESCYHCPGHYPRWGKRYLKDLKTGRVAVHWRDPGVTIVQLNRRETLMTMHDRTRPYADISRSEVFELEKGIVINQLSEASGELLPGKPWQIGDFYTGYLQTDADGALKSVHQWMADLQMTVPADRSEKVKETILYSFHPGMADHPMQDWGGFVPSTGQLPRIAALNCNTVWILPIESECPYIPDDFYKMARGIGTPQEYKMLVDTAHKLGMKVWQDVVPHGGRKTNSRAKTHPEWLLRDEKGNVVPRTGCFDYNHPGWQKYLRSVVENYTREYKLDGWRIDTSGFSSRPNWSKNLPYSRSSHAMGQGGLNMMRQLREGARKVNPDAVTLGECDGSIFGTQADMIYDFPLCRNVLRSMLTLPPEVFARELALWLDEEQRAELKDMVRLRYVDSHDEPRAELFYGPDALRAAFALTAWIDGVPMIYKEGEDGHSAVFARVLKMRQMLPELSVGKADYRVCRTSPGAWSCLRDDGKNQTIPVINFNPRKSKVKVSFPANRVAAKEFVNELWYQRKLPVIRKGKTASVEVELPAYGFTLLRFGNVPAGAAPLLPPAPGESLLPFKEVARTENVVIYRIPQYGDPIWYRAETACGMVEDRFRTRHPYYPPMLTNMYSNPLGHNTLWSSLFQPFGFTEDQARLTLFNARGSVSFSFPMKNRPAGVFLTDQFGDVQDPHVVIVKNIPSTPLSGKGTLGRISTAKTPAAETVSGDCRLHRIAGGWLYDNGKIRLRIANSGTLVGFWTKKNGKWQLKLEHLAITMRGGYGPGHKTYTSANEMEGMGYFEKQDDGSLLLRFYGRPRGGHFYDILKPGTVEYYMAYTLNNSDSFALSAGVRPGVYPAGKEMTLSLSGKGFQHDFFKGNLPSGNFGVWNNISRIFGGQGSDAPKAWQNDCRRPASADVNGLLDPSFEFEYDALFGDAVTSVGIAQPWYLPQGAEIVRDPVASGLKALRLTLHNKHERAAKQSFRPKTMHAGETWRLSLKIKAQGVKQSRAVVRLIIPGKGVQRVSVPGGSYDFRTFSMEFSAPENPGNLEVQIGGRAAAGTLVIDDLRMEKVH